ncbi:MAG: c-type cytochrome [gamma proteobacterium symbiont of Phacoides pectinatus]
MSKKYLALPAICFLALSAGPFSANATNPTAEAERALTLTPNIDNGRELYKTCAVCHTPEGWGTQSGYYPQIAGQLKGVTIKQLADIRVRNRDNPTMFPFAMPSSLGGAQEMADVAAYIETLPMTPYNDVGPGFDLGMGEHLYKQECAECHGEYGEGDTKELVPLIHGQHYNYLMRQFNWIRIGKRRNADEKMVKQIQHFGGREISAMMDYVSRIKPPEEKLAEPNWTNPDFPAYSRRSMPPIMRHRR